MEFSLNVYGPAKCLIEPIGESDRELCLALFKDSFLARCKNQSSWTSFGAPESEFQHVKYCFVHGTDGYGYCAISNRDKSMDVRAEVEIEGSNVNFSRLCSPVMPPPEGHKQRVEVFIRRGQTDLVIYEIQSLPSHVHFKTHIYRA